MSEKPKKTTKSAASDIKKKPLKQKEVQKGNTSESADPLKIYPAKKELIINTDVYPLEVIYRACFAYLDRMYIFLDKEGENKIRIDFSPKDSINDKEWLALAGGFKNELLASALRNTIAITAFRVRDLIVEGAIGGALPAIKETEKQKVAEQAPEDNLDFLDDPLGIAVPWEEKYGKKT